MIYKLFSPQQRQKQKQRFTMLPSLWVHRTHTQIQCCLTASIDLYYQTVYKKLNVLFLCLQQK